MYAFQITETSHVKKGHPSTDRPRQARFNLEEVVAYTNNNMHIQDVHFFVFHFSFVLQVMHVSYVGNS